MGTKMLIGVDLDDTLSETVPAVVKFHNEKYQSGLDENLAAYSSYDHSWPFDHEENLRRFYEFFDTDYHQNMAPVPGAKEAVSALSKENDLIIITARPVHVRRQTTDWLEEHFPGYFKEIHFSNLWSRKGLVPRNKSEICQELAAGILIDDRLEHIHDCAQSGVKGHLLDRPWNKGDLPIGATRHPSWSKIAEEFVIL